MQRRRLGNTELEFTTIGLGTWAIGGGDWKYGWGPQDPSEAIDGLLAGLDFGINWIDTAPVYGDGASEKLVGKALRQAAREDVLVATKCSRKMLPDGSVTGILDAESVKAECEQSLKRLGVEVIDLYQMHWPEPDSQIEEGWAAMIDLKQEGKVREIGVSNFNVPQMERLEAMHPISSLQPPYNMLQREVEDTLFSYCSAQKMGIIGYSPLAKGLLSGAMTCARAAALDPSDHRSRDPKFATPELEANLQLVDRLQLFAKNHSHSVAELAIAWTLRKLEVTSAIVGVRNRAQIEGTHAAADWQLTQEEIAQIEQILSTLDRV
ncbi:MAG: aldo/keto reductase [Planctomycetaceae bacterium]|nr:aldo/keto reductase [Planctomycetaceae bacterium]|tara:strand:+ start:274 stop:1239 length:966 start_codon:yes stop_codon:yes gene_type:complete